MMTREASLADEIWKTKKKKEKHVLCKYRFDGTSL
jgi:hypothetical protein